MPSIRLIKNGEVIVFDNYYTKYEDAKNFINLLFRTVSAGYLPRNSHASIVPMLLYAVHFFRADS